jgi:hypothetical protein
LAKIDNQILGESTYSGTNRIFAIVTPSLPADVDYKTIRRVLIFDNHPDSLRLVFGRQASPHLDPSRPPRVSPWELILVSILIMGALIGMFWPLF